MNVQDAAHGANKRRHGVCHRCGWAGEVSKVTRQLRKRLQIGRSFGRLCDDCLKDLHHLPSTGAGTHTGQGRKLKANRQRDVA
jgi:hypothetical protein